MMFGDVEIKERPGDLKVQDGIIMDVKHLTRKGKFQDVSFQLRKGEVLGIAGMLGSGRTELLRCIFGADPYDSGEILVDQKTAPKNAGPIGMMQMGLGLTPEERKTQGVILIHSIRDNLCYASMDKMTQRHVINEKTRKEFSERQIRDLQIKIPDLMAPVSSLSGGNQQKVAIGKWLRGNAEVLIFDEPTKGVDVKAKTDLFRLIDGLAREGKGVIYASGEFAELVGLCDRICVLWDGRIVAELEGQPPAKRHYFIIQPEERRREQGPFSDGGGVWPSANFRFSL